MHWIDLIHEFHNLSWITEINELFHDILIYWDAPVYLNSFTVYTTIQKFGVSKLLVLFSKNALNWSTNNYIKTFIMLQNIIIFNKGSYDSEDWSNDAKNSALITEINYILQYIHIENSYLKHYIIY